MTEQELRDKLISVAPSAVYANESEIQAIVDLTKDYADARESKEIAELKAECDKRGGCIIEMSQERARLDSENKELKAKIKRLRDGIFAAMNSLKSLHHKIDDHDQRAYLRATMAVLGTLLSSTPVTETLNKEQL